MELTKWSNGTVKMYMYEVNGEYLINGKENDFSYYKYINTHPI